MSTQTSQAAAPRGSRKVLWILVAVCAFPYLFAWAYFQLKEHLPPVATSNHGELISPVRPIGDLALEDIDGRRFSSTELNGKWTLLTVGNSACDEVCQRNIYTIRQIRLAMAKDRTRVQRLFLLTDTRELAAFRRKLDGYDGMHVVSGSDAAVKAMTALLREPNPVAENGIYRLDPYGNYFISYPPGFDGELIIKDLRRLLDVSQVG